MIRVAAKLAAIFILLYAGVYYGYDRLERFLETKPPKNAEKQAGKESAAKKPVAATTLPGGGKEDFQIIIRRNIFEAALEKPVEKPVEVVEEEVVVPTSLNLTLLGTITGSENDARAIIVDNKKKQQDIYQIGDALEGALIESIERGKITLEVNGRKESLLLKDREGGGPGAPTGPQVESRNTERVQPARKVNRNVPKARPQPRQSFQDEAEQAEPEPEVAEEPPVEASEDVHQDVPQDVPQEEEQPAESPFGEGPQPMDQVE